MTCGNEDNIYYVYRHVRKTDKTVFYVGKGKGRRYKSKRDRNPWWHNVVNKNGFETVFVKKGMSECCAYTLEAIEIARQKSLGVRLVNQSSGGEGSTGFIPHWRKPVVCSNGMRFESITAAAQWLVSIGHKKAKAGSVSAVCLGKVHNCYGLTWWFEGDKPKEKIDARSVAQRKKARPVISSNGDEFDTISDAAEWAKANIHPNYTPSKICACCRGRSRTAHGIGWEYKEKAR